MLKAEWFNIHLPEHLEKYYPIVAKWWQDWKWPVVAPEMLPQNGIIIKDTTTDKYIFAGWLWMTDSKMCVIDLIISSKDKETKSLRENALKELIKQLEKIAKELGFMAIFTCSKNPNLVKNLLSLEYGRDSSTGEGDKNMTIFIKRI